MILVLYTWVGVGVRAPWNYSFDMMRLNLFFSILNSPLGAPSGAAAVAAGLMAGSIRLLK